MSSTLDAVKEYAGAIGAYATASYEQLPGAAQASVYASGLVSSAVKAYQELPTVAQLASNYLPTSLGGSAGEEAAEALAVREVRVASSAGSEEVAVESRDAKITRLNAKVADLMHRAFVEEFDFTGPVTLAANAAVQELIDA